MSVTCAAFAAALSLLGCGGHEHNVVREDLSQADARYAAGASSFARYCALCHRADATGYAADHAPSLVSPTFLESASDDFIARGIREGRPGTPMAGYAKVRGGPLDDDEVGAIIAFLRDRGPLRVKLPSTPVLGDPVKGEAVYAASCQRCHGARGERAEAVQLSNTALLSAASDAFLRHAVVHGRPGTPMPAFAGVLREDEIDNVVAAMRSWARPPEPERRAPPEPPPLGQFIINPNGKAAEFTARDDRYVPMAQVKQALDEKRRLVIIDARATPDWYSMHIPGSISVPYYGFARLDAMPKDGTWIIAYCACPHHASGAVVDELKKRGYKNTAILDEGILAWKKADYPVVSEPMPGDGAGAAPGPAGQSLPARPRPKAPLTLPRKELARP